MTRRPEPTRVLTPIAIGEKKILDEEPVVEEDGQTALFGEPKEKPQGPLVNGQPPKAKAPTKEVKQADLFSEGKEEKEVKPKKEDDKGYTPGETVDLDL
jgi:hypothetical protein